MTVRPAVRDSAAQAARRETGGTALRRGARPGRRWRSWLGLGAVGFLVAAGCASQIAPVVPDGAPGAPSEPPRAERCDVQDFPTAAEVPDGAKSLGWVQVRRKADDEATFLSLRQAVCARGGDGISGTAWIREASESEPSALRASAWKLP